MKKFLYLIATILSLCVIFGSGWAAGIRNYNVKTEVTTTKLNEQQIIDEETEPDADGDKIPKEPENDCENEGQINFRIKIPVPADFRDRIIKLPHIN